MKLELNVTMTSVVVSIRAPDIGANSSAARVSRFFDITRLKWYDDVEVNWSALGGQSIEVARDFARAMGDAVHAATLLRNLRLADYNFNKSEDVEAVKAIFQHLEETLKFNHGSSRDNPQLAVRRLLDDLARMKICAQKLLEDLPSKRDWLNPDVEQALRELARPQT